MLTNYWRSGRFSGVLPLLNGGTGSATQNFVDLTTTQTVGGAKTFSSTITGARFDPTSSSASGNGMFLPATNTLGFSTAGTEKMRLDASGNLGLGITPNLWVGVKAMQLGHLSGLALYGYAGTGAEISSFFIQGLNGLNMAIKDIICVLTH
jgi:hypothetical protein